MRNPTLLALLYLITLLTFGANAQEVGATVEFDRVTANNPSLANWDRGTITAAVTIAGKPHWKIRNTAGTMYTIPNDPRWIRAAGNAPAPAGAQAALRRFPPGARVQFDRAEGTKPEYGRWDDGTVVGYDATGRVQIRGANGLMYSIHDDPRWILPPGAPLPGPRHDYTDRPAPRPAATTPAPTAAPAGGPLAGEWVITAVDGKPSGGRSMTLNFIGSRYEFIFQGSAQSGTYTVNGNTIRMTGEDGVLFGVFQANLQGNRLSLTSPQGSFALQRAVPR